MSNLKLVAADFVTALTRRSRGESLDDAVVRALPFTAGSFDATLARAVADPLGEDAESVGEIVYPQLGGLDPLNGRARDASVMVVVRQRRLTPAGASIEQVRTCDVRLRVLDGSWQVTELRSAGGQAIDRPPSLDPRAVAALDAPGLALPDTARWDIHSGRISNELCAFLGRAAALSPLSVTVLQEGHPQNVYATSRLSQHTAGRAVDVWQVAGVPVVSSAALGGPVQALLRQATDDPSVSQTGSPIGSDQDGRAKRSFSDLVHADHLHLAVRG